MTSSLSKMSIPVTLPEPTVEPSPEPSLLPIAIGDEGLRVGLSGKSFPFVPVLFVTIIAAAGIVFYFRRRRSSYSSFNPVSDGSSAPVPGEERTNQTVSYV